ncbi:MAG: hypothetical protein KDJ80_12265 [Nitratireductor sp.]|nr:hypothetical protein [Nitratireductor sp.]
MTRSIPIALAMAVAAALLASCQSGDILESAASSSASKLDTRVAEPAPETLPSAEGTSETRMALAAEDVPPGVETGTANPAGASEQLAALDPSRARPAPGGDPLAPGVFETPADQRPKKTYLINGLLSAVPFIGYGFRHLKEKIPGAELYSYMGVVEGPTIIAPKVVKEAEAAWKQNPDTMINLVGISLGADLVTVIANQLNEKGVPVNYLGIVDGTHLQPIPANVRKADNLTCSNLDCTRAKAHLAKGNDTTRFEKKIYRSSHIPLGDHAELHSRVIEQANNL